MQERNPGCHPNFVFFSLAFELFLVSAKIIYEKLYKANYVKNHKKFYRKLKNKISPIPYSPGFLLDNIEKNIQHSYNRII